MNDPVVATDDTVHVAEYDPAGVTMAVLGNDSDVDGDTLTVTSTDASGVVNGTLTALASGLFLGDVLGFAIVGRVLLTVVKALKRIDFKAQGLRECDLCKDFVAVNATRCRYCISELAPDVAEPD